MDALAPADVDAMMQVARRYYEGQATQAEIAAELGLSRMKVNRLLRQAREAGIVDVRIRVHRAWRPTSSGGSGSVSASRRR